MFIILKAMTRLLAPIFTFTAEEIWKAMPAWKEKEASVHLVRLPRAAELYANTSLGDAWKTMIDARAEIAKALEQARKDKVIGHSLDARVSIAAPEKMKNLFESHLEDLRALLIVSQLQIVPENKIANPYKSDEIKGLIIGVEKARGEKCERCWVYSESLGIDKNHPKVCERCLVNL